MSAQRFYLWDLPTRLFHWLLAVCVLAAVVSGQIGGNLIDWHARFGLAIVGLLVFRLVWGFIGSTYARFAQFLPTPGQIRLYLRGEWQRPGHNPLGALSVFALLGLIALQVASGLFANDDIAFSGPLSDWVSKDLSNQLTGWHKLSVNLLIGLLALHIAAILFYTHVKKDKLIKPMLTGWQEGAAHAERQSAQGGGLFAFLIALGIAALAVYAASGAWLPTPAPLAPAALETPNW